MVSTLIKSTIFSFFMASTVGSIWSNAIEVHQEIDPIITIWVPGTTVFPQWLDPRNVGVKQGLHPISTYNSKSQKQIIAQALCTKEPHQYQYEHFYIFGWSGKLCCHERNYASQELYRAITILKKQYRHHYHMALKIRIITYSHGGNIALSLAQFQHNKESISIDELILLACPVQEGTKIYIQDPCFKKIFNIYSESDVVQIIDPQRLHNKQSLRIFSEHRFENHPKLYQARIQINGYPILHLEFTNTTFLSNLPDLCKKIELLSVGTDCISDQVFNIESNSDSRSIMWTRRLLRLLYSGSVTDTPNISQEIVIITA